MLAELLGKKFSIEPNQNWKDETMSEQKLREIRVLLTESTKGSIKETWKAFDSLIREKGLDWETLASISVISAEIWKISADRFDTESVSVFQAMNEMVFDHACRHASELNNWGLFKKHYRQWTSEIV